MNIRHNQQLQDKLAAEYVLGTLKGGARRRFEQWLRDDAALRRTVAEWQQRLLPIAEFAPPVAPSPQVWRAIEQQLNLRSRRSFWLGLREDLSFWRGLGLVSTTLATILLAVMLSRQAAPITSYVATLADDKAQPMFVITGDARQRQLTVKVLAAQAVGKDKSLQLWAVPKDGAPRSLGLVAENGSITLPLP